MRRFIGGRSNAQQLAKMEKNSKIFIAGHNGLLGSALVRELKRQGHTNLILRPRSELDLRDQTVTQEFFCSEKPEYVFLAAAKVGGIEANRTLTGEFIYDNLQIYTNVLHSAWKTGVKKLLFLGSNCIYPKNCAQPMKEEYLLSGTVEPTNEPYAIAKIAGVKMCQAYNKQYGTNFIAVIPASLYGPNDNFDIAGSHFVAAMIRKFHEAKAGSKNKVELWGTGQPRREIMHVDDAARACLFLMEKYNSSDLINAGCSNDATIHEFAQVVKEAIGFSGEIVFDTSKPDGIMKKFLDSGKINALGWKPQIELKEGIKSTYDWYLKNISTY